MSFSSCKDDILSEITTLEVARAFSPTGLAAVVVNKTGVKLTWLAVNNPDSYTIEIYETADFSGSPVKTVSNIPFKQVPYTVTGFAGQTTYFARVKAVGAGVDDSKWVTATFNTDPEQIFQTVSTATLLAKEVTLSWPAGEIASSIVLTPGNITHTVTSAEIAAGQATLTGLAAETDYVATLLKGTKTRGTATFTTLLDLGKATAVNPGDNLSALLLNATEGQVFALFPGSYTVNADVIISKSISIKGVKPYDKPIINGMVLRLKSNAGLELKDLILDGTGSVANYTILYDAVSGSSAFAPLIVQKCEVKNYAKGIMSVGLATLIESVTYSKNLIHDFECNGADFIDFRNGIAKTFLFENNTVYNCASSTTTGARDLFRMDAGGSTNFSTITSMITIKTNTFNNASNLAAKRFLYIRLVRNSIDFSKNIVANTAGFFAVTASIITTSASNNYFNAPLFTATPASGTKNDTGTSTSLDPGFTGAATGNFTISNGTLKSNGIGDPRWR
ncbi:DUF4957 domain-containing protein [Arcticibacter eurypsychrophilus]|uniref:DUF4957 domain-containing protein n=1 Tax=Arcticibacter eurypsychrophilus TaxID=1434752 RepID=UPI001FE21ADF|nr:DUF4957 domain-containing protein [Arcticibacter eurypsychrophilus]